MARASERLVVTRRGLIATGAAFVPLILAGCETPGPGPDGIFAPTYASGAAGQAEATLPASAPTLYYVTAPDCQWCSWWQTTSRPGFERSAARTKMRFVVLHMSTLRGGSGKDEAWPMDLRWVRDRVRETKRPDGRPVTSFTPAWALVQNRDFITGAGDWNNIMWPTIQRVTGTA